MQHKKKTTFATIIVAIIAAIISQLDSNTLNLTSESTPSSQNTERQISVQNSADKIASLYQQKRSDEIVVVSGEVVKLLADDLKGSRHQKFILELSSRHTVLISHNIDLAPRINALREGDTVLVKGEYEYTDKGGVIHWTHHDPNGRHEGGWIEHEQQRYE